MVNQLIKDDTFLTESLIVVVKWVVVSGFLWILTANEGCNGCRVREMSKNVVYETFTSSDDLWPISNILPLIGNELSMLTKPSTPSVHLSTFPSGAVNGWTFEEFSGTSLKRECGLVDRFNWASCKAVSRSIILCFCSLILERRPSLSSPIDLRIQFIRRNLCWEDTDRYTHRLPFWRKPRWFLTVDEVSKRDC